MKQIETYQDMALGLLSELIAIPSFSREETGVADLVEKALSGRGAECFRNRCNVWARHSISGTRPTVLMNSHLDTVRPVEGWRRDPFDPGTGHDRIFGLGSNDAGGSLVSLLACFLYFRQFSDLPFNLVFAATAEEEISGGNGVASILGELGRIEMGIVGEPTGMRMAVAEKGLIVIDCKATGKSAHAASGLGVNAIYECAKDLEWIREYTFDRTSEWLGDVSMQVTRINAGKQHNVVPDTCTFVMDVRTNECYTNEEVFEVIRRHLSSKAEARSFRLRPSLIPQDHPVVKKGRAMGLESYGSKTLSDQALMPFPTLKIGPGDPGRSHTADEYIEKEEIRKGIEIYVELLQDLRL